VPSTGNPGKALTTRLSAGADFDAKVLTDTIGQ
jgi:hypothetical protein